MSSKKSLSKILRTVSILAFSTVLGKCVSPTLCRAMEEEPRGISCQVKALQDPLFPEIVPTKEHIKAGLELVNKYSQVNQTSEQTKQKNVTCNTDITGKRSADEHSHLFITSGGAKSVYRLNNSGEKVILYGPDKVTATKESQAYAILNAFGLISQQDPELVTVTFNNQTIEDVLCVTNFASLTQEGTQRRTWDSKNYIGFGKISVFNGAKNYHDVDYNFRLLSPLVRDMALWYALGKPGDETDSLNLIFKQTGGSQSVCRLLMYDLYSKGTTEKDNIFENLRQNYQNMSYLHKFKVSMECVVEFKVKKLYCKIYEAISPKEKAELWGGTESNWRGYWCPTKQDDLLVMWKKVEPLLMKEFMKEISRIIELFDAVQEDETSSFGYMV